MSLLLSPRPATTSTMLLGIALAVLSSNCGWSSGNSSTPRRTVPEGPVPMMGGFPRSCEGICRKTAQCLTQQGRPLGPEERDCVAACQGNGNYTRLPTFTLTCLTAPCGPTFLACTSDVMSRIRSLEVAGFTAPTFATAGPYPEPSLRHDPRTVLNMNAVTPRPPTYPEGFPLVPDGEVIPAPAHNGVLRMAVVRYRADAQVVNEELRRRLGEAGWQVLDDVRGGTMQIQFRAVRQGLQVNVTIQRVGQVTHVQTVQL